MRMVKIDGHKSSPVAIQNRIKARRKCDAVECTGFNKTPTLRKGKEGGRGKAPGVWSGGRGSTGSSSKGIEVKGKREIELVRTGGSLPPRPPPAGCGKKRRKGGTSADVIA